MLFRQCGSAGGRRNLRQNRHTPILEDMLQQLRNSPSDRSKRKRASLVQFCVLASVVAAVWAVVGYSLYVDPEVDRPGQSDVLLVLAPVPDDRLDYAEWLMEQGHADMLAVSVPSSAANGPTAKICDQQRSYPVVCFEPGPVTTRGEARALRDLAETHGWRSADVLTAQSHASRTRVLMERCFNGVLHVIPERQQLPPVSLNTNSWVYRYLYETAAFVKVVATTKC